METQTVVCSAGGTVRASLEEGMREYADRLGLECEVVEHPHLLQTQVAFKLPADITSRPAHFVEPHLVLPNGGQPNNVSNQELAGRIWKTWSMATAWDPERHTLSQLVDTVVKQWDR